MKPDAGARPRSAPRSYGKLALKVQRLAVAFAVAGLVFGGLVGTARAAERTIKVVALGDSLTAGFRLRGSAAFPVQLEQALKAKGLAVDVVNAGVSGDTSSGGLARLTRDALAEIVRRLKARHIEVLLCGMLAAPNLGADYGRAFDAIYPELAAANDLLLYPFFLDGVVADPKLNIGDGLHPTGEGVAKIVSGILPKAEALLARVRAKSGT